MMSGLDELWNSEAVDFAIRAGNINVAESTDGILGMVHGEALGQDLVMWKLYVFPDQQRHGIGTLLARATKNRARLEGKDLVTEYEPSANGFVASPSERGSSCQLPPGPEPTRSGSVETTLRSRPRVELPPPLLACRTYQQPPRARLSRSNTP